MVLYVKEGNNELHITEFEKLDVNKEYDRMFNIMKGDFESCNTAVSHIEITTPVFGEWNIIKDRPYEFAGLTKWWNEKIDYEEETS